MESRAPVLCILLTPSCHASLTRGPSKNQTSAALGPDTGVASFLSLHARSWESTWGSDLGSPQEVEGVLFVAYQLAWSRPFRHTRPRERFRPPPPGSRAPTPKRRHLHAG